MHRRVTIVGCVSGSIFPNSNESARKTYGSPQHCNRLIYNVGFFLNQPLHEDTEFEWQPYWQHTCRPFYLPSQAPERCPFTQRYSCPRGVLVRYIAIYSTCAYLHHWTLTSTACNSLPEGRYEPI